MTFPDPAAPFTGPLGRTDHRAAEPLDRKTHAAGLLPDPRTPHGPRWATTPPTYPEWFRNRRSAACPSPTYCALNGSSPARFPQAAVPADPELYERPRGWGRQFVAAGLVAMAGAALVVAYLALVPW